jgi:hypothetical protein
MALGGEESPKVGSQTDLQIFALDRSRTPSRLAFSGFPLGRRIGVLRRRNTGFAGHRFRQGHRLGIRHLIQEPAHAGPFPIDDLGAQSPKLLQGVGLFGG